jgi:bacteriocin biosynthesis cyclodehydratase domain-containing protein
MTSMAQTAPSESVILLGLGEFGDHVVALLRDSARWPTTVAGSIAGAFGQESRAIIFAMWRPCPAACEEADALAFHHRQPWLPVVMDHPHVRVGPLVMPGSGACFACFSARYSQHDGQSAISAALHAGFDRDPGLGPRGYLDHHARLAAALAEMTLRDLSADWMTAAAAQVRTFNVYRSAIRRHPVAARSGCPRCGSPASASDRSPMAELLHGIAAGSVPDVPGRRPEPRETADAR